MLVARATQAGDVEALRKLFHPANPNEQRYIEAVAQQASALAKIRDATVKAFGQEVAERMASSTIDENRLRGARAKIESDKASVLIEGSPEPLNLVKVGGAWKMSPAQLTRGKGAQIMEQELEGMKQLSAVLVETAQELSDGKYTTPEQLDDAIRGKRIRAMTPTTAPAEPR